MYVWSAPNGLATAAPPRRSRERFLVCSGAAILAAIALSTATASLSVDFADPPAAVHAGESWDAQLRLKRPGLPVEDARPLVTVTDGAGKTHVFPASPGARPGTYHVKIILPEDGRWTYEVHVGSRVYERGTLAAKPSLPEGL